MTNLNSTTRLILSTLLCSALAAGSAACGDDDGDDGVRDAGPVVLDSSAGKPDATTGTPDATARNDAGATGAAAECLGKVYSELSDGCSACACAVDPALAPACGRPCWDFLACSFKAQAGKCATFAAGGAAMRPQFEACTMEECGKQLAVPGAEVVSSYRTIIGGCAVPMGTAPAACSADVAKFTSELK